MHLLPKKPRATWLLAGAVWLAGVGALWWALPTIPRGEWRLPTPGMLIGYGADGTILSLAVHYDSRTDKLPRRTGPLRIHDAETGHTLAAFFVAGEPVELCDLSPDCRWCAIGVRRGDVVTTMLIDVAERRDSGRAIGGASKPGVFCWRQYSPDVNLLAIDDHGRKDRGVALWDVAQQRERSFLPDVGLPGDFSADGRFLATPAGRGADHSVSVFECATGALRRTIPVPATETWPHRLSDDGSAIVAPQCTDQPGRSPDIIRCWDVATGEKRWERQANAAVRLAWVDGGRMIVSNETGTLGYALLVWTDAATGKAVREVLLGGRAFRAGPYELDPVNRRLLIVTAEAKPPDSLERLAAKWGIRSSPPVPVGRLFDSVTGEALADLPGTGGSWSWSPDGRQVACLDSGDRPWVRVWDVPPRPSIVWFAAGAALLAVPPFLLAGWRVQRLRRRAML
jgi:hypothetical protein